MPAEQQNLLNFFLLFFFCDFSVNTEQSANPQIRLQHNHNVDLSYGWNIKPIRLLLFWQSGHRELRKHGRQLVRCQLANTTSGIAEIFHSDDWQHSSTTSISWLQHHHFEFGNIFKGTQSTFIFKFDSIFFIVFVFLNGIFS